MFEKTRIRNALCFVLSAMLFCACLLPAGPDGFAADAQETEKRAWNTRYAVSVYGIQADRYQGSETEKAGLTFGPATGDNYTDSYQAHVTQEEYERDPQKYCCIHWMSWEQIAEQSKDDPTVFQACLENGCTHSVDICLNDTLKNEDYSGMTGDGAGGLLDSIQVSFQAWNGGKRCRGGWPASRIRMTLNGADDLLDLSDAGTECFVTEADCLFSCFPEELQNVIVAKEVVSDLDYDGSDDSQVMITYDKLWLFSSVEVYGDIWKVKATEGEQYERNARFPYKGHAQRPEYQMFSESGQVVWAWFRSASGLNDVLNYHIFGGGHDTGYSYYNHFALTPGFCLA